MAALGVPGADRVVRFGGLLVRLVSLGRRGSLGAGQAAGAGERRLGQRWPARRGARAEFDAHLDAAAGVQRLALVVEGKAAHREQGPHGGGLSRGEPAAVGRGFQQRADDPLAALQAEVEVVEVVAPMVGKAFDHDPGHRLPARGGFGHGQQPGHELAQQPGAGGVQFVAAGVEAGAVAEIDDVVPVIQVQPRGGLDGLRHLLQQGVDDALVRAGAAARLGHGDRFGRGAARRGRHPAHCHHRQDHEQQKQDHQGGHEVGKRHPDGGVSAVGALSGAPVSGVAHAPKPRGPGGSGAHRSAQSGGDPKFASGEAAGPGPAAGASRAALNGGEFVVWFSPGL